MRDIGSIFPLWKDSSIVHDSSPLIEDDKILLSLCREALCMIAAKENTGNSVVMLPAYTCDTVITPFKENKWNCCYFPINRDLSIDIEGTLKVYEKNKASLVVIHPYFGMDLNDEEIKLLDLLKKNNCKVVLDITQCLYTSQYLDQVDYYIASYRKWYQVPDGAFLWPADSFESDNIVENNVFVSLQADSMYLRGKYFENNDEETKRISIRLNKMATEMVDFNISPHKMSDLSYAVKNLINEDSLQNIRLSNYKYLYDNLLNNHNCTIVCDDFNKVKSAPLYFVIYSKNRSKLQRKLIDNNIYAPIIWPVYYNEVLINDTVSSIYDEILAIPIDQRYNTEDMTRIIDCINNFKL